MSSAVISDPTPYKSSRGLCSADIVIAAAGFEERAAAFMSQHSFKPSARCVLVRFDTSLPGNADTYARYLALANSKFDYARVTTIDAAIGNVRNFELQLDATLWESPQELRDIWIDVSGLPAHLICTTLRLVRDFRPLERQAVIYTAALEYNPSKAEFDELRKKNEGTIEFLPRSMALEMADNLIPDAFSGHRTNDRRTALAVFAGYEAHRSAGVIDNINPSILLLLFGLPGDPSLRWRLELSQELHAKFQRARRCATEVVSTLNVSDSLRTLETYYEHLYDDFDLTISPVCSKMHTVATYLFWEKYKEVQLAFPLPIGYDPGSRPTGIGITYRLELQPSRFV